tara:strand:+ start:7067 stop:7207 length:141 start_codon:yes stop_codon:yes gene_type:complete
MKKIKAIAIDERIHKRLKKYCAMHGLKMGEAASKIINQAICRPLTK